MAITSKRVTLGAGLGRHTLLFTRDGSADERAAALPAGEAALCIVNLLPAPLWPAAMAGATGAALELRDLLAGGIGGLSNHQPFAHGDWAGSYGPASQLMAEVQQLLRAGTLMLVPALYARHGGGGGKERPPSRPPIKPPKKPPVETETWFEVVVVDEIGEPIAGAEVLMRLAGKSADEPPIVTDGSGRARIDGVKAQFAQARIDNLDGLRNLLKPRWDGIREEPWLTAAPDTTIRSLQRAQVISASLLDQTPHTLVIQPWVIRVRLLGSFFEPNKCFVVPQALTGLHKVTALCADPAEVTLLIAAHSESRYDSDADGALSLRRAESVEALLRQDVDGWLNWYGSGVPHEQRWDRKEDYLMITALPDFGRRPRNEPAVVWFQRSRGLLVDGDAGPITRRKLIGEYQALAAGLPAAVEVSRHGCAGQYPLAGPDAPYDERDRRAEVYFFDVALGVQPPPPGPTSKKGAPQYPQWVLRAQQTFDYQLAGQPPPLFEWPNELGAQLPADLALKLTDNVTEMTLLWSAGLVHGPWRRFVFDEVYTDGPFTLSAVYPGGELRLLDSQFIDRADQPIHWQHWLEDLALPAEGDVE